MNPKPEQNPQPSPRCAQILPELKAFADGELSPLAAMRVRLHLRSCPNCQEELVFMQTISEELERSEETTPLAPELRERILEQAPVSTTGEAMPVSPRRTKKQLVVKMGFALACAAFLFVVGSNIMSGGGGGSSSRTPTDKPQDVQSIGGPVRIAPSAGSVDGAANMAASSAGSAGANAQSSYTRQLQGQLQQQGQQGQSGQLADGHIKSRTLRGINNGAAPVITVPGSIIVNGSLPLVGDVVPDQRAVHREGSVTVAVDNAETASNSVESLVKNSGGFVANNGLSTGSDGKRSATLDVRVPVDKFETVLSKIGELGMVRAKKISGEDITENVTKAGARKATLSNELSIREAQLRKKEQSAKKKDAMTLYYLRAEVRDLRVRASQARAELEYLRKYAALSTLFVTLQDKSKPVAPASWSGDLSSTGHQALSSFISASKLPIQLVIWILAYSPLWVPLLIIWKKWGRQWLNS